MCGLKQGTSNTQLMLLYMITVKSKLEGILYPHSRRFSTNSFYLTSAMENTAINPIWPVSQEPILKLTTGLYRVYHSLYFLLLIKQNKIVPFKKTTLKTEEGSLALLFILRHDFQKAEPAEKPSLGNQRLVCRHLSSTSQSTKVGLGRTGRNRNHFPQCRRRRLKRNNKSQVTSAQWEMNGLVF